MDDGSAEKKRKKTPPAASSPPGAPPRGSEGIRGDGAAAGTVEIAGAADATTAAHVVGVAPELVVIVIVKKTVSERERETENRRRVGSD